MSSNVGRWLRALSLAALMEREDPELAALLRRVAAMRFVLAFPERAQDARPEFVRVECNACGTLLCRVAPGTTGELELACRRCRQRKVRVVRLHPVLPSDSRSRILAADQTSRPDQRP